MASEDELELLAMEILPENPYERLEHLRRLARGDVYPYAYCPECGADLADLDIVAHALTHYPEYLEARALSHEARMRERALYALAKKSPPERY
jgi:hypothetical protein